MAYIEMNPKMQVLIVDHNEGQSVAMRNQIKKMGYTNFVEKPNGFEAMKHIKEGNKVDFIIARYQMPVMSGFDMFNELKSDMSINRMPVLIFSEKLDEGDVALLNEAGVDAYLTIPYVAKDLAGHINGTWSRYIDPTNVEFHFEMARKSFLARKLDEAARKFQTIEASGKLVQRAKIGRARVLAKQEKLDDALALAREVAQQFPNFVHGHQALGEILMSRGDLVNAVASFKKALDLSPKNPYRYSVIGDLLTKLQMWKEAEGVYRQAEKMQLALPELERGMAQCLILQNKKAEALDYYLALEKKNPKDTAILNNIAVCYRAADEKNRALNYYNRALEAEPDNVRIMYNIALVQMEKANSQGALDILAKILTLNPDYEKARLKRMQIQTPTQFREFMALKKALGASDDLLAEEVTGAADGPKTGASDKAALSDLMSASFASAANLEGVPDETVVILYLQAVQRVRLQLGKLQELWFARGREFTEELTSDMLNLIQTISVRPKIDVPKAASLFPSSNPTHQKLVDLFTRLNGALTMVQDEVFSLIEALQFQDYVSQTMGVIERGHTRFVDSSHTAWADVAGFLNNDAQRAMYKQIDDTQKGQSDWTRFNLLMIGLLKTILAKVEETNVNLKKKLTTIDGPAKTIENGLKVLQPLFNNPPASLPKTAVDQTKTLVQSSLGCEENITALRGLADFNAGFNKDIATLANITRKITELNLKTLDSTVAKKLLTQYGTDLQKIWDTVRPLCSAPTHVACLNGALKAGRGS